MRAILSLVGILSITSLYFSPIYASVPNEHKPTTFLPAIKVDLTRAFSETKAYSVAAEAGDKNFRLVGTVGFAITDYQRLKVSADYLLQNIDYAFFSGNTYEWMQQGSIGARYEYFAGEDWGDFWRNYNPILNFNVFGAHAPSKELGAISSSYIRDGLIVPYIEDRRIAGSNSYGFSPGILLTPWINGNVDIAINYDDINYHKNNNDYKEQVRGMGFSLNLKQLLPRNFALGMTLEVRKPFDYYAAELIWNKVNLRRLGYWNVALFADYTVGRATLMDTWGTGLSFNYLFDQPCRTNAFPGRVPMENLTAWSAKPAVYLPQVLAVVDNKLNNCVNSTITLNANILDDPANSGTIDISSFFTGTGITYSIRTIQPLIPGDTISINSAGVITYSFPVNPPYEAVVTAQNGCTSTESNIFLLGTL